MGHVKIGDAFSGDNRQHAKQDEGTTKRSSEEQNHPDIKTCEDKNNNSGTTPPVIQSGEYAFISHVYESFVRYI